MAHQLMKAVLLHGYGDISELSYEDVPVPRAAAGEVLVKTIAVSINPIDWKLRRGDLKEMMPLEFPTILGRDLSGEVVALGEGVDGLKVGERVFGLVNRSYAEYVVCKPVDLARTPENLDGIDAAALPLVLLTGSQVIEVGVRPRPGEIILITGAIGGVGRTAVHVAKQHGAHVIAGVRSSQRTPGDCARTVNSPGAAPPRTTCPKRVRVPRTAPPSPRRTSSTSAAVASGEISTLTGSKFVPGEPAARR